MIVRYCDKCGKALKNTEQDFSTLNIRTNYDTNRNEQNEITKFIVSENSTTNFRTYQICSDCALDILNSIKHIGS